MRSEISQYVGWGYHLVPYTNRKANVIKPLIKEWNGANAPSMESIVEFDAKWPECDWAIVPRGTIVFDIENKNGKDGLADFKALCDEHGTTFESLIDACPYSTTPNQGRHLWMRLPEGSVIKGGFYLRRGIEIKCDNGSAHVPPSMGRSWLVPLKPMVEIPVVPAWLMSELFKAKATKREQTPFDQVKIPSGHRRDWLLSCAGKLRQDFAANRDELRAMLKTLRDTRCEDPTAVSDDEVYAIADDYAGKLCDNTHALAIAGDPVAQHAIRMFAPKVVAPPASSGGSLRYLSEGFCRPNKVLSLWMDWYKHKCVMYQPELALLSMLTTVSAMVGRSYTWRDFQANLYGLCLGGTGVGKEAVKRVGVELLEQSGLGFMLGSGSFASDAGVLRELATSPEIMWVNDEFQTFISQLSIQNAPSYVKSIERVLTEGYTGTVSGRSLKTEQHDDIKDPYPVLLALSQPETFWKSMNMRMVESGFLGRFIIVSARPLVDVGDGEAMSKSPPPSELVDLIKCGLGGRSALTAAATATTGSTHKTMESTPGAEAALAKLRRDDKVRRCGLEEGSFAGKMAARTLEKAVRVAMCRAWTDNPLRPVVTEEALLWSVEFVKYCDDRMVDSMEKNTAGNPYEQALKRIKAMVLAAKERGVLRSTLVSKLTDVAGGARDDMIANLIESHFMIEVKTHAKSGKGRPSTHYIATEYQYVESET